MEGAAIAQLRLKQAQKAEELRVVGQALAGELAAKKALHKNFRGVLLQLQAQVGCQTSNPNVACKKAL